MEELFGTYNGEPRVYETDKGNVTISKYFVTINNTVYDITGEQQCIGEYEDYYTENTDAFEITDTNTGQTYYFEMFYHRDAMPEENCFSYRLKPIKNK